MNLRRGRCGRGCWIATRLFNNCTIPLLLIVCLFPELPRQSRRFIRRAIWSSGLSLRLQMPDAFRIAGICRHIYSMHLKLCAPSLTIQRIHTGLCRKLGVHAAGNTRGEQFVVGAERREFAAALLPVTSALATLVPSAARLPGKHLGLCEKLIQTGHLRLRARRRIQKESILVLKRSHSTTLIPVVATSVLVPVVAAPVTVVAAPVLVPVVAALVVPIPGTTATSTLHHFYLLHIFYRQSRAFTDGHRATLFFKTRGHLAERI